MASPISYPPYLSNRTPSRRAYSAPQRSGGSYGGYYSPYLSSPQRSGYSSGAGSRSWKGNYRRRGAVKPKGGKNDDVRSAPPPSADGKVPSTLPLLPTKIDGEFRVLTDEDVKSFFNQLCAGNPLLTERDLTLHELRNKHFPELSRARVQMNRYMAVTKVSRQMNEVLRLQQHQQKILALQKQLKQQAQQDISAVQQQSKVEHQKALASLPFDQHYNLLKVARAKDLKRKAAQLEQAQYKAPPSFAAKRRAVYAPRRTYASPVNALTYPTRTSPLYNNLKSYARYM